MHLRSKFIGFTYDYSIKSYVLHFSVESTGEILQDLFEQFKDKVIDLKAKIFREKRSLDANAYYWKMVSLLAGKLGISNARLHNLLLADFGEVDTIDGQIITVEISDTEKAYNEVLEASTYHLKPTSQVVFENGEIYRVYHMMKGSHEFDTKQMSRLINGLVDRCHEAGIPTISEQEAERMLAAYGKKCIQ